MIEIKKWIDNFSEVLQKTFGTHVWFVGLQGSYGRGEATEASDIDLVVILDEVSPEDIRAYSKMLDGLPNRDLVCGFFSGRDELLMWEPSDLFQFFYDTTSIQGSLDELLQYIDKSAVDRSVRIGACNIYHACVHNMLYEKSEDILRGLYKSASFTVQAVWFRQTGRYVRLQKELLDIAAPDEREIVGTFLHLKNGGAADFEKMSDMLFLWLKKLICSK
ncbi:MAG: nucleotidyltransferase domain-containing protein [Oscillospiraceae bacterium]|nr:nucleotidyltransferase domain-containing protein [Oscillospiraceae bacterium]